MHVRIVCYSRSRDGFLDTCQPCEVSHARNCMYADRDTCSSEECAHAHACGCRKYVCACGNSCNVT